MPNGVEILEIKPSSTGTVRARVNFRIGGVTIIGAKIVQQDGQRAWVAMPDVKWEGNDGKPRYTATVELSSSLKQRVSDAILTAWNGRQ